MVLPAGHSAGRAARLEFADLGKNEMNLADLTSRFGWRVAEVPDVPELNRTVAEELIGHLRAAVSNGRQLVVIAPVGPLDYHYWTEALNAAHLDGGALVTVNMDEYLGDSGDWVAFDHPLSFRRFMRENLFDKLTGKARMPEENLIFPDPHEPQRVTEMLRRHGGADICYAGIGLSGHLAFNDPPQTPDSVTRSMTLGE